MLGRSRPPDLPSGCAHMCVTSLRRPIVSCTTVSKLLQIIGQIFAFDRGYLSFTHSLGVNPKLKTMKFGLKKLETYRYMALGLFLFN